MPEPSKEQIEAAREWLERDTTFRILDTWIRDRVDIDRVEDSIAALLAEREDAAYRRGIEDAAQIVKNNGARRHTLMRDIRSLDKRYYAVRAAAEQAREALRLSFELCMDLDDEWRAFRASRDAAISALSAALDAVLDNKPEVKP